MGPWPDRLCVSALSSRRLPHHPPASVPLRRAAENAFTQGSGVGMGWGLLRAQETRGGGAGGVACMHKIYRARTQVRSALGLAVLGKRGQGKGCVPGLSDLSSFLLFVFFLAGPCPRSWHLRAHQNFSLQVPSTAGGMGHVGA